MNIAYNLCNIEALFKEYISSENNNLNPTTIKNYISDFKHFIGWLRIAYPDLNDQSPINQFITAGHINKYLEYLNSQQVPIKTYSRRLSTLRRLIQFGADYDMGLIIDTQAFSSVNVTTVKNNSKVEEQVFSPPPQHPTIKLLALKLGFLRSLAIVTAVIVSTLYVPVKISGLMNYVNRKASSPSTSPVKDGRVFSFQGHLTDSLRNNITSLTPIQFKLYNSPSSKTPIYQTGPCSVTPDRNGYFSVLIGGISMSPPPQQDTCGKEVGSSVFSDNSNIYMGTTVAADSEMSPREPIANVGYAVNSETLQGLTLGSSSSSVPYLSSDGTMILSINSPTIASTSTSGTFSMTSGSDLLLKTANDGDITLNATGSGAIRFKTGGSSLDRIFISDGGNVGINTAFPSFFRLQVSGSVGADLSNVYNLGSSSRIWNDIYADRLCLDGASDCITSSLGIFSAIDSSSVSELNIKGSLVAGNSVTSGTTTLDIGGTGTSYALCHSSQSGSDNQKIVDCTSTPTADFAEMYPVEPGTEFGDVMTLGSTMIKTKNNEEIRQLIKSSKFYDSHVIGIVSDNYGDYISVGHNITSENNPMPIALKGRVPVKISSSSDPIQAGDYLTTSSDNGKAVRASGNGVVIGKALESWEPGQIKNKIMVFVGIDYVVQSISPLELLAQGIASKFSQQQETLSARKTVSPVVEISELKPETGKDLVINLSPNDNASTSSSELSKLVIKGIKKAVVASIDGKGNLKSNGTIEAENGIFNDSITASTIKSKTTDILSEDLSDIQNKLTKLALSTSISPNAPAISSNALSSVSHESLLTHLVVTEQADVYALSVKDRISSNSDTLRLIAGSSISLFDDSVTFSKDGNIVTKGKITAQELEIKNKEGIMVGSISSTGSATLDQLHLPKNAGTAIIPEGENETKVLNSGLTQSSLIYITPESQFEFIDKPLILKGKKICKSSELDCTSYFIVRMSTNNHLDLKFNWLIIN